MYLKIAPFWCNFEVNNIKGKDTKNIAKTHLNL